MCEVKTGFDLIGLCRRIKAKTLAMLAPSDIIPEGKPVQMQRSVSSKVNVCILIFL